MTTSAMTLAIKSASQRNMNKFAISKIFSFNAGVVDTGYKPLLSNIGAHFRKNSSNGTMVHGLLRGPSETDSGKKPKVENLADEI